MTWSRAGTVAVAQNSNAVIGTGTAFIADGRVGDAFIGPDGALYEVTNIPSNTAMSIAPDYKGVAVASGNYALAPMQGYNKDTADALRAASLQVGDALDGLEESVLSASTSAASALASKNAAALSETSAGSSAATAVASKDASALSATSALASKNAAAVSETNAGNSASAALASKNAAALSEANAAASAGTAATLGVGRGYIDGLRMAYVSANSISVSPGSAYIPGIAKNYLSAATITISGLTLTANTFYHVYLYDNAGVPAIDVVTTVPVTYAEGGYTKTGDTTRRFLGSILVGAANTIWPFTHSPLNLIQYSVAITNAPFVLSNIAFNTPLRVSCAAVIPVTGYRLVALFANNATDAAAYFTDPSVGATAQARYDLYADKGQSVFADIGLNSAREYEWSNRAAANGTTGVYARGYYFKR